MNRNIQAVNIVVSNMYVNVMASAMERKSNIVGDASNNALHINCYLPTC